MAVPEPLTAVSQVRPGPPGPPEPQPGDHGVFRAVEPGSEAPVVLRPGFAGLVIERDGLIEFVSWAHFRSLQVTRTPAGRALVMSARVELHDGPHLTFADAYGPGADKLPFAMEPGGSPLLRVARLQLLCATIVAAADLRAARPTVFDRGPRGLPDLPPAVRPRLLPRWAPPLLLAASIFALQWLFELDLLTATLVTGVVLGHEYGHVIAMHVSGVKVRGVVFIPFLGAGTLPEHAYRTRWHEACIHLAGPLTGIPMAAIALALWCSGAVPDKAAEMAFWWALALNLANLLPLLPLDGGRVLLCLTTVLPRAFRTVATMLPLVLVVVVLVFAVGGSGSLAPLAALFLAFSFVMTRLHLKRYATHSWMQDIGLRLSAVREALRDVTFAYTGRAREDADGGVPPAPLTSAQAVAVAGLYAAEVAMLGTLCLLSYKAFVA